MLNDFSFAKRTNWSSSYNRLISLFKKLRDDGVEIFDLTESNPTQAKFSYPEREILDSLSNPQNLVYSPQSQGLQGAREILKQMYDSKGLELDCRQILLTSSTSEAYSVIFRLLLNPLEKVMIPTPSYPLFQYLAELNDLVIDSYDLKYDGTWSIDFKSLADSIHDDTKALILVNPNNPTGSYISPDELNEINAICADRNIALISDEVFWDYQLEPKMDRATLVNNKKVLTFCLGGLSKSLALPQMKLSWIVTSGPESIVGQALNKLDIILDTYLSVNTPVQNALKELMKLKNPIQDEIKARVQLNQKAVRSVFGDQKDCKILQVQGGWYQILKVPSIISEEDLVLKFLQEDHVFVHPGYFFDFWDEAYLVISLITEPGIFKEGLARIYRRIQSLSR